MYSRVLTSTGITWLILSCLIHQFDRISRFAYKLFSGAAADRMITEEPAAGIIVE